MKSSKRLKSLTKKEFGPHALPISGRLQKETLGASWHWQVGINPWQVSSISRMRSLWNCRAGLLTCFTQGMSFIQHKHTIRVSKAQQKTCSLREQRTRAPSILTLSWRILDEPRRWKVVIESWRQDSWPPEKKNSIWGQRQGLIAQNFCAIEFY